MAAASGCVESPRDTNQAGTSASSAAGDGGTSGDADGASTGADDAGPGGDSNPTTGEGDSSGSGGPRDPDTGDDGLDEGSTSAGVEDTYGYDTDAPDTTDGNAGTTTGDPGEPQCCGDFGYDECLEEASCRWQPGETQGCVSVCDGLPMNNCADNPYCYWIGGKIRLCAAGGDSGPLMCGEAPGS